ncbi:LPS export ABC transporter ATP-binding protein [Candidatus Bipolaricaulota bacterium]|nr:LPS export ABC transporter ATP-binding protein [Candidatus Bipolaricaulota bacterium]
MALAASDLVKTYKERRVVDQLSLRVQPGEVIGLLGPNGAGKTTTFHMMIGFIATEEGKVLLNGTDISALPFYRRAQLGISYLPQEPSVFTNISVEKNLDLVLEWSPVAEKADEVREELLAEFRLERLRSQRAGTLSSGERRRLEIARALATCPSYILLDEPFSGIDPISVTELQEEVVSLKERGLGLIITDHNVRDTLSIIDYAYLISEGRVITAGTPEEVLADPLARRLYLGERFQT